MIRAVRGLSQVGAASTTFWVDVQEGIVVIFMSQLLPWTEYNYMRELRVAVNQAMCDAPHWAPRPAL